MSTKTRDLKCRLREADRRFSDERDRRYAEVDIEREKALKIKEAADANALGLAREIQNYKDEKANELREQISSERGLYATKADLSALGDKVDATLRPLLEYVSRDTGRTQGMSDGWKYLVGFVGLIATVGTIVTIILALK